MGVPNTAQILAPPTGDRANAVASGSFTGGAGNTSAYQFYGPFNLVFGGASGPNGNWSIGSGGVYLERSFDGGTTWYVCGVGGSGAQAVWNTANQDVSVTVVEVEEGVLYRLHWTGTITGTVNWRMSTSGAAGFSFGVNAGIF